MCLLKNSHTLTVAELPAHTHGRGTQEIWGDLGWLLSIAGSSAPSDPGFNKVNSATHWHVLGHTNALQRKSTVDDLWFNLDFLASRGWSGTSESIGSDTAFSILPPYSVAYCFKRVL